MVDEKNQVTRNSEFKLRVLDIADVDSPLILAWNELEQRAVEPNPFLSPNFVLPALVHLENKRKVIFLFVEKLSMGSNTLVGVGLFTLDNPSKYFPLPHLTAFHTKYSYLSGLLVDRNCVDNVVSVIYRYISNPNNKWQSLVLHDKSLCELSDDSEKRITTELGLKWVPYKEWERAKLVIGERENVAQNLSRNVKKALQRRTRRLEELGEIKFAVRSGNDLTPEVINRFLALENMGWKGTEGTSILSHANDTEFFRQMVGKFNETRKVFFSELYLNNTVIASNVTLVSGKVGFAFKLGWDPEYAKLSAGNLLEAHSLSSADPLYVRLEYIDGCSDANAEYMNVLWLHRRRMKSGVYAINGTAKALASLMGFSARVIKRARKRIG